MKSAEDFKKQAQEKGITEWRMHDCSICGYPCGYLIDGDNVRYDSGCDCTGRYRVEPRSFQDIANHYNMQTNLPYIETMDKFWGFEKSEDPNPEGHA